MEQLNFGMEPSGKILFRPEVPNLVFPAMPSIMGLSKFRSAEILILGRAQNFMPEVE